MRDVGNQPRLVLPAGIRFSAEPRKDGGHQILESALGQSPSFGSRKVAPDLLATYQGVKFAGAADLLKRLQNTEKSRFSNAREVISFSEYLDEVYGEPTKYLRNSSQYTVDAIDYFNLRAGYQPDVDCEEQGACQSESRTEGDELLDRKGRPKKETADGCQNILGRKIIPFVFAKKPWLSRDLSDRTGIEGQELALNEIYQSLKKSAQQAHSTRMLVLHGPNATGKTQLIETLYEAMEQYSRQEEGALYRFNWVFKDDILDDLDSVGIELPVPGWMPDKDDSYDSLYKSKDISVIIPANLNTNPVFLLPPDQRVELLRELESEGKLPTGFNKDFVIQGNLDSSSKKIYNALLRYYDGDASKVLSHIQVERFALSKQSREGLAIIPAQETRDARLQALTADIDWSKLPEGIQETFRTAGLVRLQGPLADANRGHLMYDDMWKTGVDLSMLRLVEKGKMTLGNVEEYLDSIIWATTNDKNISNLDKNFDDWESLKERISFIPVGYVRRYKSAANIYKDRLQALFPEDGNRIIGPHVLDTFGLWTSLTYLLPPKKWDFEEVNEKDKEILKKAITKLKDNMLAKALLYQGEDLNAYAMRPEEAKFTREEQIVLNRYLRQIADEYNLGVGKHKFLFYEGGSGFSPRDAWELLQNAALSNKKEDFTVLELFDELDERIKHGLAYEEEMKRYADAAKKAMEQAAAQNMKIDLDIPTHFQSAESSLEQVKDFTRQRIRYDVQQALGLLKAPEDHLGNLRKYMEHVRAKLTKEDVARAYRDPSISGEPNEEFMSNMEKVINPAGKTDDFRKELVQRMGSWSRSNPGEDSMTDKNLEAIYGDLLRRMVEKDVNDTKQKLKEFLDDVDVYYESQKSKRTMQVNAINHKRMQRLERALEALKASGVGYTDKTLPKMIDFAFDEKFRKWLAPDGSASKGASTASNTGRRF